MKKTKIVQQWTPTISKVVVNGVKSYRFILTNRQYKVLTLWMIGKATQFDIGAKIGICQTNVHKTLFGNMNYKYNKKQGGVFKKIDKWHSGKYTVSKSSVKCLRRV